MEMINCFFVNVTYPSPLLDLLTVVQVMSPAFLMKSFRSYREKKFIKSLLEPLSKKVNQRYFQEKFNNLIRFTSSYKQKTRYLTKGGHFQRYRDILGVLEQQRPILRLRLDCNPFLVDIGEIRIEDDFQDLKPRDFFIRSEPRDHI